MCGVRYFCEIHAPAALRRSTMECVQQPDDFGKTVACKTTEFGVDVEIVQSLLVTVTSEGCLRRIE